MKQTKRFDDSAQAAPGSTADLIRATEKLARFSRISWKQALGEFASPAIRLHRYRNAHNRLLLDALCERDCSQRSGEL